MLENRFRTVWSAQGNWVRAAVIVWAGLLAVVGIRSALEPAKHNVFHIFTLAGEHWRAGEQVYGYVADDRDVFLYSPLLAATFAPWSILPLWLGNVLWRVLATSLFLWAMFLWIKEVFPQAVNRDQIAQFFLFAVPMTLASVNNGQINPLLTACLLFSVVLAKRQQFVWCGVVLGAAFWIKVYPLSLALLLLLVYRRQLALWLPAAILAGFALPFLLQQPAYAASQYGSWLEFLQTHDKVNAQLDYWPRDVRLLFRNWAEPISKTTFLLLGLAVASVLAGLVIWVRRAKLDEKELLTLITGMAVCWMLLFGPGTESATYTLLAPSAAAFFLLVWHWPQSPWLRGFVTLGFGLLVATNLAKTFPWGNAFANFGPQPVGGLILLGCLIVQAVGKIRAVNQHKAISESQNLGLVA
jgi:hypothetical protein